MLELFPFISFIFNEENMSQQEQHQEQQQQQQAVSAYLMLNVLGKYFFIQVYCGQ